MAPRTPASKYQGNLTQAHLTDTAGSIPGHHNIASTPSNASGNRFACGGP